MTHTFEFVNETTEFDDSSEYPGSDNESTQTDQSEVSDIEDSDSEIDNEDVNNDSYGDVIKNMRAIIKIFRLSPVRNSILQKNIKRKLNKELQLIIDTPTRWNSLHSAAERFLTVHDCIIQSLHHKDINKAYLWSQNNTLKLEVSIFMCLH